MDNSKQSKIQEDGLCAINSFRDYIFIFCVHFDGGGEMNNKLTQTIRPISEYDFEKCPCCVIWLINEEIDCHNNNEIHPYVVKYVKSTDSCRKDCQKVGNPMLGGYCGIYNDNKCIKAGKSGFQNINDFGSSVDVYLEDVSYFMYVPCVFSEVER